MRRNSWGIFSQRMSLRARESSHEFVADCFLLTVNARGKEVNNMTFDDEMNNPGAGQGGAQEGSQDGGQGGETSAPQEGGAAEEESGA